MNGTMTALVWRGAGELRLEKRPLPHIQDPVSYTHLTLPTTY